MIKLGGSLITDKDRESVARVGLIERSFREIKRVAREERYEVIVGHGVGSFAHIPAAKYQTGSGIINDESRVGAGITKEGVLAIHSLVLRAGLELGLPLFSLAPGSFLSIEEGSPQTFITPLLNCLKFNLWPLIYGDVITDNSQGFGIYSTEKSFEIVGKRLSQLGYSEIVVIHLGITNGVYDGSGKTIPVLNSANYAKHLEAVGKSKSVDVTGGMKLKVETALRMAQYGVKTYITEGATVNLPALVEGQEDSGKFTLITS